MQTDSIAPPTSRPTREDGRRLARERQRARRRRARRIRRWVLVTTLTLFLACWVAIFGRLATGHDPTLGATARQSSTTGASTLSQASAKRRCGEGVPRRPAPRPRGRGRGCRLRVERLGLDRVRRGLHERVLIVREPDRQRVVLVRRYRRRRIVLLRWLVIELVGEPIGGHHQPVVSAAAEVADAFACFGARCAVLVIGDGPARGAAEAVEHARGELLASHDRFSRFDPASELSRLNRDPRPRVPVSQHAGATVARRGRRRRAHRRPGGRDARR